MSEHMEFPVEDRVILPGEKTVYRVAPGMLYRLEYIEIPPGVARLVYVDIEYRRKGVIIYAYRRMVGSELAREVVKELFTTVSNDGPEKSFSCVEADQEIVLTVTNGQRQPVVFRACLVGRGVPGPGLGKELARAKEEGAAAIAERDALKAQLAEVTRERDEAVRRQTKDANVRHVFAGAVVKSTEALMAAEDALARVTADAKRLREALCEYVPRPNDATGYIGNLGDDDVVTCAAKAILATAYLAMLSPPPDAPLVAAARAKDDRTIFECRTCDRSTWGWTNGKFVDAGWSRIDNIDGPNAICPYCQQDSVVLDGLREDYPRAAIASLRAAGVTGDKGGKQEE